MKEIENILGKTRFKKREQNQERLPLKNAKYIESKPSISAALVNFHHLINGVVMATTRPRIPDTPHVAVWKNPNICIRNYSSYFTEVFEE